MGKKLCSIEGCARPMWARSWCGTHYRRWAKHGSPYTVIQQQYANPEEAFAARTEWVGECLIWTGSTDLRGYGQLRINNVVVPAHRYAWERENGEVPVDLYVDHMEHCDTACVNIEHLRIATNSENMQNRTGLNSNNSSGHRNVYWSKQQQKWQVTLMKNYKKYHYGFYTDLEEAAKVAEQARKELFGEFAGKG